MFIMQRENLTARQTWLKNMFYQDLREKRRVFGRNKTGKAFSELLQNGHQD
jgi:hypothetical protein